MTSTDPWVSALLQYSVADLSALRMSNPVGRTTATWGRGPNRQWPPVDRRVHAIPAPGDARRTASLVSQIAQMLGSGWTTPEIAAVLDSANVDGIWERGRAGGPLAQSPESGAGGAPTSRGVGAVPSDAEQS